MNVLAIETATIEVGVSLYGDDGLRAAFRARPGRRHAETLHPAIEQLLGQSGITLGEVDLVAVDRGPGLFTGLRVGVAAAKALSYALSVPIAAATSTRLLIEGLSPFSLNAVPVIDMRRGQLAFELPGDHLPRLGEVDALVAGIEALDLCDLVLVGDGALRHEEELKQRLGGRVNEVLGIDYAAADVVVLARVARAMFEAGDLVEAFALEPLYLRQPDAVKNWTTRHDEPAGSG